MTNNGPPLKITIFKSDTNETEDSMYESEMLESATESAFSNSEFRNPPISTRDQLMESDVQENQPRSIHSSSSFDPDKFIEKSRGHVAQPTYINPRFTSFGTDSNSSAQSYEDARYYGILDNQSSLGVSPILLSILAYFFAWIGAAFIIVFEKKNMFTIFHAWQSFISGTFAFIIQMLFIWSSTMYTLMWICYLIFTFFMIWRVIQDAPTRRLHKLPLIGDWCEQRAQNKVQIASGSGNFYRFA